LGAHQRINSANSNYLDRRGGISMFRKITIIAILAAASLAALLTSSTPAHAAGGGGFCGYTETCTTLYYYDAGKTQESGWWKDKCGGVVDWYGDVSTPYSTTTITGTCSGGGGSL
jgi:hypothetical protein